MEIDPLDALETHLTRELKSFRLSCAICLPFLTLGLFLLDGMGFIAAAGGLVVMTFGLLGDIWSSWYWHRELEKEVTHD